LLALGDGPARAQQVTVGGRVVRRAGADTLAAASARVVLHRVSREVSGKLDSTTADPRGRFLFRFQRDTTQVYLLSTRWSGIEYFSEPLPGGSLPGATSLTLLVADTSSARQAEGGGRFLVLGSPGPSRDRRVVDLLVLRNGGTETVVGRGGDAPTWRAPLPRGVLDPRVGAVGSEISPEAVRFERDSIMVIAPIAPGEKQLLVEYTIPAGMSRLELDPGTKDTVQVVAEESDVRVEGLDRAADQVLDGRSFSRWTGRAASSIVVSFPVAPKADRALLPLVSAALVLMALLAVWAATRARKQQAMAPLQTTDTLITRIAQLDAEHAGRELSPAEAERYRHDRAVLKRALTDQLRREGPRNGL
jgi:hypothetical protein